MTLPQASELACVPAAIPATERSGHFALGRELLELRARERVALPNGYAIRFEPDAFEAVARFVANERKCCPFLTFELTLDPALGALWLRMTGPEGTRGVLDAELNLVKAERQCNCAEAAGSTDRVIKWTTAAGVLAALGVCAACCLLPFALLSMGVAGAWVSGLDAFARYKWPLIGLAVGLLGYGFYTAYVSGASKAVRVGLWIATILTLGGIVFEHIEPMLATH